MVAIRKSVAFMSIPSLNPIPGDVLVDVRLPPGLRSHLEAVLRDLQARHPHGLRWLHPPRKSLLASLRDRFRAFASPAQKGGRPQPLRMEDHGCTNQRD